MSAPVISASSSILGFKRNEVFQFQPGATNSPSSWAITSVPSEITIDSSTGLISCTGINIPGPIVFTVTATNGDGAGTKEFVIGISSESAVPSPSTDVGSEWDFDMVTRVLTPLQSTAPAVTGAAAALANWKLDDVFLLRIRCRKNGEIVDPVPTALRVALKEYDPDPRLVLGNKFLKTGSGATAYFDLLLDLSVPAVKNALLNYEKDSGTSFAALIELQLEASISFTGTTGGTAGSGVATTLRISSQTGTVLITRDLAR